MICSYGYDSGGNTTSLDDSLGGLTSYSYDVRDELTTITQSGSGVSSKRVDFAYDAALRRTTLTRFSDTTGTTTVLVTKYAYDAADRLTTLTHHGMRMGNANLDWSNPRVEISRTTRRPHEPPRPEDPGPRRWHPRRI